MNAVNLEPPKPPPEPVIPPQHYASSVPDRVNVLERTAKATDANLRRLEEDVAKLLQRILQLETAQASERAEPAIETVLPAVKATPAGRRR